MAAVTNYVHVWDDHSCFSITKGPGYFSSDGYSVEVPAANS